MFKQLTMKKIFLILSLILLILTSFRIIWITYHKTPVQPLAERGVIDLREWKFTNNQSIPLNGEWEFFPNEFKNPPSENDLKKKLTSVPGNWYEFSSANQPIHYGTYRVKILLPNDHTQLYGLRIQDIASAARIFVDGSLITTIGQPSELANQYKSKLGTYKTIFYTDQNEIEILLHVANYENTLEGGITKSIKFGTDKAINKEVDLSKTLQLLVSVILVVHSLYAFGLYFMRKSKSQKELLYFGLLLLFASFSILVDEDKLLISLFSIDATWSYKLLYVSFAGTVFFILKFVHYVFKIHSPIFQVLFILYGALAFLLLLVPFQITIYIGYIIMLLNAFSYSIIFIHVLKVIRNGNSDAIYILLANVINLFNVLWGIAINMNMIDIPYYPFDYLIAISAFAGYLFKRQMRIVELNEEQTKELQMADKKKDEFLANTSHELRNPLHGVINIAQSILADKTEPLSTKNQENLKLLIRIGQRMTYTLNDILDISRLQEQHVQLNKRNINIHGLATGVLDMVQFMTDGKDLQLKLNIPATFPKLYADENRLIQILFNLIHNAVKFTSEGTVTIDATHKNGMANISIKDTGIGMSAAIQQKIFQAYEQENASETSIGGGIGLGLFICRQLVELHNGTISVESKIGQGSVFTFTIPLAKDVATDTGDSTMEVAAALSIDDKKIITEQNNEITTSNETIKNAKILVVDDDPVNLKILNASLAPDYEIVTVTSGGEALNLINTGDWDLIISDVMMPNMSGYELTRTLRKQFSISELPIILLTARSQLEDIYTGFISGANDYVSKPVDALELQVRVKALTTLKQSINEQLRMEAAWLQAQIQPHFLFNTLNTIASLSEIDTERMVRLLEEFGIYLRRSFDVNTTKPFVPLKDELELTRSYLYIEQERFGDRLRVKWMIDELPNLEVPPLSIQPIVENAVRHGVLKRIRGGTICIQITNHDTYAQIAIIDDGVGIEHKKLHEILSEKPNPQSGIGIANTNRRLKKLYGKGLVINSTLNEGTTVNFQVPIKYDEQQNQEQGK